MTHPTQNDTTPATEQNGNSNVDSWIQLADCLLKTIKPLAKSNSDTNKSNDDTQEKGGNESTSAYHAALVSALSGSVLASLALADPLATLIRAISFLVRQARRDDLEWRWMTVIGTPSNLAWRLAPLRRSTRLR